MRDAFRTSLVMLAILTLLTGVAYPLAVTVVAQFVFPQQANGSLIVQDGRPVGSSLIGQPFTGLGHFWARPSATSPVPYNAASSAGSNLGPLNPALTEVVAQRVDALRREDPSMESVPVDLVTASGSGLDPHISPAAAETQVRRVAKARGLSEDDVRSIVTRHIERRQLGLFGEPRVNVLLLNLALDFPESANSSYPGIMLPTHHAMPTEVPNRLRTNLRLGEPPVQDTTP